MPSIFPSIRVFSSESALCIRWPKYWSFSISPSNEYSGLVSFKIDWFDLLAVQGTLKSLLQHHILKASILQCSAFLMVQLSHLYMTIGKTIALTVQTFVSKVMSLLFHMLSMLVIAFLPRNKSLNFMTVVTMETVTDFIFLGSKITVDGDCSHEIKRCLSLGRKAMTNLDSILKSRDITLPTKVCTVKAMVFPIAM